MNNKNIILSIAIVGLLTAGTILAQGGPIGDRGEDCAFDQQPTREEFIGRKQDMMSERLELALENGNITQTQKGMLEAKNLEMLEAKEGLSDLAPEQRREEMHGLRQEMKDWSEENGVSLRGLGKGNGHFRGVGK